MLCLCRFALNEVMMVEDDHVVNILDFDNRVTSLPSLVTLTTKGFGETYQQYLLESNHTALPKIQKNC